MSRYLIIIVMLICGCDKPIEKRTFQEGYDKGVKYLEEEKNIARTPYWEGFREAIRENLENNIRSREAT